MEPHSLRTTYYATASNYNGGKSFQIYLVAEDYNTEMIKKIYITDTDKNPPSGDAAIILPVAVVIAMVLTIIVKKKAKFKK